MSKFERKKIETFRRPEGWLIKSIVSPTPAVHNGVVKVRKYRITVEEIPEPIAVLGGRLEKLWRESGNHHHHGPLEAEARRIGYVFTGKFGSERIESEGTGG